MKHEYIYINNVRLDLAPLASFILDGNKILAIKEIREHTGVGLKEAKILVDRLEIGDYEGLLENPGNPFIASNTTVAAPANQQSGYIYVNNYQLEVAPINTLLQEGGQLQAIKEVREKTGLGLREAKELVEQIEAKNYSAPKKHSEHHTNTTTQAKAFNRVQHSRKGNKVLPLVLFFLIIALLGYYLLG